jgi:single-strand DNA-binding protein
MTDKEAAMASLNKVLLIGNLTRDPELRYIPSGTAVAKFGLAVNREYTDKTSGEKKETPCFVDITVWGRQAEICNQYLTKGRPVLIEGRLEYSSWETKEGDKRNKLEVVGERIQFLGSKPPGEGGGAPAGRDEARPAHAASRAPARSAASSSAASKEPASTYGASGGVSDGPPAGGDDLNLEDIPF